MSCRAVRCPSTRRALLYVHKDLRSFVRLNDDIWKPRRSTVVPATKWSLHCILWARIEDATFDLNCQTIKQFYAATLQTAWQYTVYVTRIPKVSRYPCPGEGWCLEKLQFPGHTSCRLAHSLLLNRHNARWTETPSSFDSKLQLRIMKQKPGLSTIIAYYI